MATLNTGRNAGLYSDSFSIRKPYRSPYIIPDNESDYKDTGMSGISQNDGLYSEKPYRSPYIIHDNESDYLLNKGNDQIPEVVSIKEQEDALKRDLQVINEKIASLEEEIAYQEILKKRESELAGDPLYEAAKENYIRTGDMGELNNILGRKIAKETLEAQRAEAVAERSRAKSEVDKREKTKNDQAIEIAIQDYLDAVEAHDIAYGKNSSSSETKNAERKMNVSKLQLKHAYVNAGRLDEYENVLSSIESKVHTPKGSGSDDKPDPKPRSIAEIDTDIKIVKERTSKSSSDLSKDKEDLENFYNEKIAALEKSGGDYKTAENEKKKDIAEIDEKIDKAKSAEDNLAKAKAAAKDNLKKATDATEKSYKDQKDRDNAYEDLPEGVKALLNKSYDKATRTYRLVLKRSN